MPDDRPDASPDPTTARRGDGRRPKGGLAAVVADVLRREGGHLTVEEIGRATSRDSLPLSHGWQGRLESALRESDAICRIAPRTYDLFERRITGVCLLHTLTAAEVRLGVLLAEPDLADLAFWWAPRSRARSSAVSCLDGAGNAVQASLVYREGPQPLTGPTLFEGDRKYAVLDGVSEWLRRHKARPGDEIGFTPEPPDARRFRLSLHRRGVAGGTAAHDASFAEAALAVLRTARTWVLPSVLLRRVAGQLDLRGGPPLHFPIFILGRDPRFAFDGTFYIERARAEELGTRALVVASPRPEDYPQDWPDRDPREELARYLRSILPEMLVQPQIDSVSNALIAQAAWERTAVWSLLQDRARLLHPPASTRQGNVTRGPWPGSG